MSADSRNATPRVEHLLTAAYRDYARLSERRAALMRSGIELDYLPNEVALMAFALLGEHERVAIARSLEPHWPAFQAKGLVSGSMAQSSAAELRLLEHAEPHLEAIEDLWGRLTNASSAPQPPEAVLRCASQVSGLWGQTVRIHFQAEDVSHLLIAPEPIFGMQPALVTTGGEGRTAGHFAIPIDDGAIAISVLSRTGDLFRHTIRAFIERSS